MKKQALHAYFTHTHKHTHICSNLDGDMWGFRSNKILAWRASAGTQNLISGILGTKMESVPLMLGVVLQHSNGVCLQTQCGFMTLSSPLPS